MTPELWQKDTIEQIISIYKPNEDVLALILFGSLGSVEAEFDDWSDIDLLVVVKDSTLSNFFPTVDWLKQIGAVYSYSQSTDEYIKVTRVCFEDFQRIDFVITTEGGFAELEKWPRNPFYFGGQILFSRNIETDKILDCSNREPEFYPATNDQVQELVRAFRFKSMLAIYKVVRTDLLIALHLALDLIRDCGLLGMMIRDRKEGTNIHKVGGMGNQVVEKLQSTQKPFTALGILETIEECNIVFGELVCEWSSELQVNIQPIMSWIEHAKAEINT
jgi:predicted nucleotidyltransferase